MLRSTRPAASPRPHDPDQLTSTPQEFGRFDRSFFIHLVVSFVSLLLVVAGVELILRFSFVIYEYRSEGAEASQLAAERVASDVESIMLNSGGPVASRTIYPILERNFRRVGAGFDVAIEPSAVTVRSIHEKFGFEPKGTPARWRKGSYNEGRVDLHAEKFCLQCHTAASVGDVLGSVIVRDYLSVRMGRLWHEVQFAAGLNIIKIVVYTVILFFLMRKLMAPLLSFRGAVSQLAEGRRG